MKAFLAKIPQTFRILKEADYYVTGNILSSFFFKKNINLKFSKLRGVMIYLHFADEERGSKPPWEPAVTRTRGAGT